MRDWTTSLLAIGPGSQNTNGEKAAFYVFQAVPEVLTSGAIILFNVRDLFNTGLRGDSFSDPKPEDTFSV